MNAVADFLAATGLTPNQAVTLGVLAAVVGAMILDRFRADVVALTGAAVLLMTGAVKPVDVQVAFASPAIIALAALFVIAYAMERSGLLDKAIGGGVWLARKAGATGIWIVMVLCGAVSAFLNNTPIVVLAAPVIRDVAKSVGLDPRRYLMPLSYITVLGGCCTLIGTSTNLLVNDMARSSGSPTFSMFEIAPVGLAVAAAGGAFLFFFAGRLIRFDTPADDAERTAEALRHPDQSASIGNAAVFAPEHSFHPWRAFASLMVFIGAVTAATMGVAPIAATAFAGAVLLILIRVIDPDEAYRGLRPEILMLIAGMVVIGVAMEETGLAAAATARLVNTIGPLGPLFALIVFYGATVLLTELLSNATVAVLLTPVAVSLAEGLAVHPKPFVAAVMIGASAAFATPYGYQTNALVFQLGGYRYMDFVRVGLPLNLVTWAAACIAIPIVFPF
ncbi:SLC13/DASS family transporter [Altererythrobacter aerius]|uniref:SLC13/DASS family transporter n=1 Tax=Tsuneonella aeria TaxID=1837929 RepID=A0A6I4TFV0_9SPHN|nr:SLC13 family permease [Tsuneonella aeria]MXO75536.1 SLC13/DASS family transporter [Tsuneonella aeria]